jgi:hypothetical protein
VGLAYAQRPSAADYPAHGDLEHGVKLGAEYLVHSVPTPGGTLVTNDYLAIDVGIFGPKNTLTVRISQFTLRINGKTSISTQSPGMVAGSIKYPEWSGRPTLTGNVGDIEISSRPSVEHFPGDPTARGPRSRPTAPEPESPPGTQKTRPMPVDDQIQQSALPEGELLPPARGLLFFPYRGKTKAIKSLELLYDGPAGKASLKFF